MLHFPDSSDHKALLRDNFVELIFQGTWETSPLGKRMKWSSVC